MQYSYYVDLIDDLLDAMSTDTDVSAEDLVGALLDLSGRCETAAWSAQERIDN